jgi:hypothetical protein
MIIFAKIRLSIDYKVFILLNVHPAENSEAAGRQKPLSRGEGCGERVTLAG